LAPTLKIKCRGTLPFFVDQSTPKGGNMNVKKITRQGMVAAIYVVLTLLSETFGLGYGSLQFRLSETLAILPFFNPEYTIGVTLGCFLANIASTVGIIDMVVGTLATFVVALIMTKIKNFYIACLVPVVVGMVPIALEIYLLMPNPVGFWGILGELMLSEALVIYAVGVPVFYVLCKNKSFTKALEFKKDLR
jgi:hypothetical protein